MFHKLKKSDPALYRLLKAEVSRQSLTIDLIPSENIASSEILEVVGSALMNKYSEGYPGARYYPGNDIYDKIEKLAQKRALNLFKLKEKDWAINVQPYSGSPANLAIYLALLEPLNHAEKYAELRRNFPRKSAPAPLDARISNGVNQRESADIMGMSLASGGHLTHGHRVSFSGKLFKVVQYGINPKTGLLDYKEIEKIAKKYKPKIIVSGATAYPRKIDFKRFNEIAKKVGAYHLADISHIAGLIAAGLHPSPFPYADIVMTTTHKTLRGPRGAVIFIRKDTTLKTQIHPNDPQKNIIEKELSYKLGGIFFEIQNELGRFCRERQYSDALSQKLEKHGLKFQRELPIEIAGRKSNFADFIVENRILIEVKAKPFIEKDDYFQTLRYLEALDLELALLINFRNKYLKAQRLLNPKYTKRLGSFVLNSDISGRVTIAQVIDRAVFPGLQGGPHNNITAAKALCFYLAQKKTFKKYSKLVVKNAQVLAAELKKFGFKLMTGGTDNHLILVDLKNKNISGIKSEEILEKAGIIANRNSIFGDPSPFKPSGIRMGTPYITSRGMKEKQMKQIAKWIHEVIDLGRPFNQIKKEVEKMCKKFPLPYR